MLRAALCLLFVLISISFLSAQSLGMPSAPGSWSDPALNHNRLIQNRMGEGTYKLIGPFKVKGTPFLYGEKHEGDFFSADEKAWNLKISYNVYNQELEFYSKENSEQTLVKQPGELDSFIIHADPATMIDHPLKFVYGTVIGAKDKFYYQELYTGSQYSLYKKYKGDLNYVSDNYIQSELRQFDMDYEYYYIDHATKQVKKLKKNSSAVVKEFKNIKDISALVDATEFTANPELVLRKIFTALNEMKKGF